MSPPAGPGHDCLGGGAGRLPRTRCRQGRPGRSHHLSRAIMTAARTVGPRGMRGSCQQTVKAWTRRDTVMDARQMTAMAEATRLTRQGRLVEATALIQQTLAGPAATRRTPDAPPAGEENTSAPDYHLNVPAPLPALWGKPPSRIFPSWIRSRAFPSRGVSGPAL